MKIRRNTPDLLIAEYVPWFLAVMLFLFIMAFVTPGVILLFSGEWAGLLFAGLGGGLGFAAVCVFVERLQVILDAASGTATIRRRTVLSYREDVFPLSELSRAVAESTTSNSNGSRQTLYRPTLVLQDQSGEGELLQPVTDVYSSGGSAKRLVSAINAWMDARGAGFADMDPAGQGT